MKFTTATIAAFAAFLPLIEGHLFLNMPGAYRGGDPMPPLAEDGSNFPCAVPDFNQAEGEGPTLTPGAAGATIQLSGTAVHSGGSCQISITYDQPPTRNSVWKVMKSFQGACPININGNLPDGGDPTQSPLPGLQYMVPANLPGGRATVAWTWFNRSGRREMYMRCHKATVNGNGDMGAFNALPDMFVANIATRDCTIAEGLNLNFPNPGNQVEGTGDGSPTGSQCGASGPSGPVAGPPPTAPPPPPPQQVTPPPPPAPVGGGACSEGQRTCDGSTWAMCANGVMVNMGPLAAGTDCSAVLKRGIRFSSAHMAKRAI